MENRHNIRHGFCLNSTILATVRCIKNDRVRFMVTNTAGETYDAWYYVHGEHINLHQIFTKEEKVMVRVLSFAKTSHNDRGYVLEVRPEILPIDIFLKNHPIGSVIEGKVEEIKGSGMLVRLAENVFCQTKRIAVSTGTNILCELHRYNPRRKILFAHIK